MADILQMTFPNVFSYMKNDWLSISIKIWLKFIPKCLIDNKPALVHIMAWRRTGDKPFSVGLDLRRHMASLGPVLLLRHDAVARCLANGPQWI